MSTLQDIDGNISNLSLGKSKADSCEHLKSETDISLL